MKKVSTPPFISGVFLIIYSTFIVTSCAYDIEKGSSKESVDLMLSINTRLASKDYELAETNPNPFKKNGIESASFMRSLKGEYKRGAEGIVMKRVNIIAPIK